MSTLPPAILTLSCGTCGDQLETEGEDLVCWDCRLIYNGERAQEEAPTSMDPEAGTCGKPHHIGTRHESKPFHTFTDNGTRHVLTWRDWTHTWEPCHLPATHTGLCDWPVTSTYEMRPA